MESLDVSFLLIALVLSGASFLGFEHLHRLAGHDGRDRVLVDKLRMSVTAQQHAEIIEGRHDARELHTVDEKDRQRNLLFANGIKEKILKVLRTFRHRAASF
jgi:hypothetical protein